MLERRWTGPLGRLMVAVVIFLICLLAKTQFPVQTEPYQEVLAATLTASTDFRTAFTDLGEGLARGDDVLEAVGEWCVAVFSPEEVTMESVSPPDAETLLRRDRAFFAAWKGDARILRGHLTPEVG